ncbi:class A beta-lactamase [Aestuariispira insulae]|uniref:Beta-lactamase n=1 Tax=Aestuariispira insulae TaxID=1461337 RepID=A0A3D9HMY0_9PROT|nr:class A beta-lactamase [Aestuariispira insulae]RED50755.1 beta-lactamase class A/beta-lactamase class A CARB-5 [Aestuariispira insulae]
MKDVSRRAFAKAALSTAIFATVTGKFANATSPAASDPLTLALPDIENRLKARLGAYILDTETNRVWQHRARERFPLNSTFKAFACAGILAKTDRGEDILDTEISFGKADLVTYSPVTEGFAGVAPMPLSSICQAAMHMSDNTAANLVLDQLGGPEGFNGFMQEIGDHTTRLDRWEPELNEAAPGDPRDTTSPEAAANSLMALALGDRLSPASRAQLNRWLEGNQVSGPLFRSSLPKDWLIGDRSGAGGHGSRSIIAVLRPPKRKPVIAAVYITDTSASFELRNNAIAVIGEKLMESL